MSFFCSKPTTKHNNYLVHGYIRLNIDHIFVPPEISSLCFEFYHDIIYWQFKNDNLQEFYDSCRNHPLKINQPQFTIKNIPFALHLIPKYAGYSTTQYIRLSVYVPSLPDNILSLAVYCVLFCHECNYEFRHLWKIPGQWSNLRPWYSYGIKYDDIRAKDLNELNFGCYLEVLHISKQVKYISKPSKPLIFKTDIKMAIHCKYEWILNKYELDMFKNAPTDFSIYSQNFNNECFCIVVAPNGLTTLNCEGYVLQKIKLMKLPYGIYSILCDYEMTLQAGDNELLQFKRSETRKYDYRDTGKNCKDDQLQLKMFNDVTELKIMVNMNIIKVFVSEKVELKDKNEWEKYGINNSVQQKHE